MKLTLISICMTLNKGTVVDTIIWHVSSAVSVTMRYVMITTVRWDSEESLLVYYKAGCHSFSLHQGSTSQGLTKHLLVLCLFAMSSASFCITCVVEDMWQRERLRARESEREMKTKRRQRAFVFCCLPELSSPPEYFVNKLNPAPDHKSFHVMWICF